MTDSKISGADERGVMLLNPERVCYLGLLGSPSSRSFGALTLYWAPDRPFRLCRDGYCWELRRMALVTPYQPHRVAAGGRFLGLMMMEPEYLTRGALLSTRGALLSANSGNGALLTRLREGCTVLKALARDGCEADGVDVDRLLLGGHLDRRRLDPRVERVLDSLRQDPTRRHTAVECARLTGLSSSRFLHLFKQEVGINFRKLRAWKRARALLYHVKRSASLTDIALDTGYPDSTHFSHSIRRTYGLTPRDILAGSRRLSVMLQGSRRGPAARRVLTSEAVRSGA